MSGKYGTPTMGLFMMSLKRSSEANMSRKSKRPLLMKAMEEPFGPPPKEYNYRCSVCGAELLVNEAIIDAGIALARFNNEYYEGYMPKVGCPVCNGYTMECIDEA